MDVGIRKATIEDLKRIQVLNLMLFEKEHEEYDDKLNLEWAYGEEGMNYFRKKIEDQEESCVFVVEFDG